MEEVKWTHWKRGAAEGWGCEIRPDLILTVTKRPDRTPPVFQAAVRGRIVAIRTTPAEARDAALEAVTGGLTAPEGDSGEPSTAPVFPLA